MSLWVFCYQKPAVNEWLLEDSDRWLLEDGSGYWLLES
jgi:hypothetical protein